jgi:hypothetical protein
MTERLQFLSEMMWLIVPPEPEDDDILPPEFTLSVVDAAPWMPTEVKNDQ